MGVHTAPTLAQVLHMHPRWHKSCTCTHVGTSPAHAPVQRCLALPHARTSVLPPNHKPVVHARAHIQNTCRHTRVRMCTHALSHTHTLIHTLSLTHTLTHSLTLCLSVSFFLSLSPQIFTTQSLHDEVGKAVLILPNCSTCNPHYSDVYMVRPAGMPEALKPGLLIGFAAALGLGFCTMMACVVSMIPAMPHAFVNPLRVTLAGSKMPAAIRSSIVSVICASMCTRVRRLPFACFTCPFDTSR
jgi:hypothetical protein